MISFIAQPRFRRLNKIDFARFTTGSVELDNTAQLGVLRAMDFSHLTELHLSGCSALDDYTLPAVVLAIASSLRTLDVSRCHNITRISDSTLQLCSGLEELHFTEMFGLEHVRLETSRGLRVKSLGMQRCWALRTLFVTVADELERISVIQCMASKAIQPTTNSYIGPSLIAAALSCPSLISADLSYCTSLRGIGAVTPNLRNLKLTACQQIDESTLSLLLRECPKLEMLDLNFCLLLTEQQVSLLGKKGRSLMLL